MNEKCKYCKHLNKCSDIVEYNSFYCLANRRFPKTSEKSYDELLEENKRFKEKLERANEKIEKMFEVGDENGIIDDLLELQKILDINKGK